MQNTVSLAHAGIDETTFNNLFSTLLSRQESVEKMVAASFLNNNTKRNYWQSYQGRLKQLIHK